jgi:hypothetical protein
MCLSILKKRFDPPLKVKKIGYKVFQPVPGGFIGCFVDQRHSHSEGPYQIGKKYYAEPHFCSPYGPGFHILAQRKDALRLRNRWNTPSSPHVVKRVLFSEVVALGIDFDICAVAQEMTILKD